MGGVFQRNETVICTATVKASGVLVNPSTSMKIDITDPVGTSVVTATSMGTPDSTGVYHYDYAPATTSLLGVYKVKYTATDGSRITIQADTFLLE